MARRKSTVKPSVSRSLIEDFTKTIDEGDHEYLEELLGYNSWDAYRCIGTADGGSLTDEDDASSFAPWGGVICPSQRFFGHHKGLRREIENHTEDDKEDGGPFVDTLELDSARKADSIRRKLKEGFEKDFFGKGTNKERQR